MFGVMDEPTKFRRFSSRFDELRDVIVEHDREALTADLRRWSPEGGIDPRIVVEAGNTALKIIEQVIANDHDLVVVTADSTDHATLKRLLRKCPCPVWVIRPSRQRKQRVLVAVNVDPAEEELNQHLLRLGEGMVEVFGGDLHVVHAWHLWGESTMRSSAFIHTPADELDQLLEAEHHAHVEALDALLATVGLTDRRCQRHVINGAAPQAIKATVLSNKINLLVMGTVARKGLAGALMGNTAETVIDEVSCSMIAAKPPGFVSPLARTGH